MVRAVRAGREDDFFPLLAPIAEVRRRVPPRSADVSGARFGDLPQVDLKHVDPKVFEVLPQREESGEDGLARLLLVVRYLPAADEPDGGAP